MKSRALAPDPGEAVHELKTEVGGGLVMVLRPAGQERRCPRMWSRVAASAQPVLSDRGPAVGGHKIRSASPEAGFARLWP
jgi:hypothetical protein